MLLLKRTSLYFGARILPAVLGFAGVAIYTRFLDPANVGLYALLLSIVLLTSGIGYGWLRVAGFRMLSGTSPIEPDMAATMCVLFLGTSVLVVAAEALALHLMQPGLAPLTFYLTLALTVAYSWFDLCTTILQSRMKIVTFGLFTLARSLVTLPLSLALIFGGFKTDALLGGFLGGNLTALAASGVFGASLRGSFDRRHVSSLFHFGWPNSAMMAVVNVSATFQRYVMVASAGAAGLGIFSVAGTFSQQAVGTLISCVAAAGQPLAFKARDSGDAAVLRKQLSDNAQLIFGIALPCGIGLATLAGPISSHFLGAKFQDGAAMVMALTALSATIENMRISYFDQAFEIALRMKPLSVIAGMYAAVLTGASLLLIPRYGVTGAAVASLLASMAQTSVSIVWGRRMLEMPIPRSSLLKTGVATAGMVLAIRLVAIHDSLIGLAVSIAVGLVVYVSISAVMRLQQVRKQLGRHLTWLPAHR
jgi:O-antigen/teichoic acid export membrane protein